MATVRCPYCQAFSTIPDQTLGKLILCVRCRTRHRARTHKPREHVANRLGIQAGRWISEFLRKQISGAGSIPRSVLVAAESARSTKFTNDCKDRSGIPEFESFDDPAAAESEKGGRHHTIVLKEEDAMKVVQLLSLPTFLMLATGCGSLEHTHSARACPPTEGLRWSGIYSTVVVPWAEAGGIDEDALAQQIAFHFQGGVNGFLILGTIGEGEHATMDERAQMIAATARLVHGRAPIVVGIHSSDPHQALMQLKQAKEFGGDAVLVKYLGRPHARFEEIYNFYRCLAAEGDLPLMYYHFPSQTGLQLTPRQVADILTIPGMIGIKESTLNLREVEQHMMLTAESPRLFFSGTGLNLTQFLELGGHGAMCPEALIVPRKTVELYQQWLQGNVSEARTIQESLCMTVSLMRGRWTPPRITRRVMMLTQDYHLPLPMAEREPQARLKAVLARMGVNISPRVKPPLRELGPSDQVRVNKAMEIIGTYGEPSVPGPVEARNHFRSSVTPNANWPFVSQPQHR